MSLCFRSYVTNSLRDTRTRWIILLNSSKDVLHSLQYCWANNWIVLFTWNSKYSISLNYNKLHPHGYEDGHCILYMTYSRHWFKKKKKILDKQPFTRRKRSLCLCICYVYDQWERAIKKIYNWPQFIDQSHTISLISRLDTPHL